MKQKSKLERSTMAQLGSAYTNEKLEFDLSEGPFGTALLVASKEGLVAALWNANVAEFSLQMTRRENHPILTATRQQLSEYFAKRRTDFDLPLAPRGTPFQLRAWNELSRIPFGETISYGEQARRLGGSRFARAVGGANGKNPIAIIIPCHRVIGADGALTGFALGTEMKRSLLLLEGHPSFIRRDPPLFAGCL